MQAFLIIAVMMYLVATAHLSRWSCTISCDACISPPSVLAGFCFYKSIFVEMDVNGAILYLQTQKKHWEFYVLYLLLAIQTWSGDALVVRLRFTSKYVTMIISNIHSTSSTSFTDIKFIRSTGATSYGTTTCGLSLFPYAYCSVILVNGRSLLQILPGAGYSC